MSDNQPIPFEQGSGNVYADLGLPDAEELSIKTQLVIFLRRLMKTHGLTQKDVATRVGTDQPTISKVLNGKLDLVTTDRLLLWLEKMDQEIQINITDKFTREKSVLQQGGRVKVAICAS